MLRHENSLVELEESNFDKSVEKGVTLVDFWAPWCRPCLMQAPILDEVAQSLAARATVAKVNVDDEAGLAERFAVQGIPTLIIFQDGKMVKRLVGVQSKQILVESIETYL